MRFFKAENRELHIVYLAGFVFIAMNAILTALEIYFLPVLPFVIILLWLAFVSIEKTILLIVFFTPLSIPLTDLVGDAIGFELFLPTEPLLAGIMILFFLKYMRGQRLDIRILRHPVTLAIYFHLAWMFITSITSTMPMISFKFLVSRLLFVVGFYFIAAQIFKNPQRIRQYLWAYIIPFALVIIYVVVRHSAYGLNNQMAAHFVVRPFYNDHTSYGAVLAMILPVLIALFVNYKKMDVGQRFLFLLLIVFFILATVLSYTRAAWVSLAAAIGVWIIIKLRIKFSFIVFAFIVLGALFFSLRTEIIMELEQNKQTSSGDFREHVQSIYNVHNDASNLERINRWSSALRMFEEKPVFGWGPGTYMFQYAPFQVSHQKTSISTNAGTRGNAHSEYLGPLSEQGVLGMVGIVLILITTLITGIRVLLTAENPRIRILALGILLGLVTYYVHGLLNNFLDTDKASVLFWGFTAMLVAIDIYHRRDEVPANNTGKTSIE